MQASSGFRLESLEAWLRADAAARSQSVERVRERIRTLDDTIQAWVTVAPDASHGAGPLAGIPVGIKDAIETANLPTAYGSPLYKGRCGTTDAAIVREFRRVGAVILGKTHTAAFAYKTHPVTRNPRDLEYSPGGSSSGSAAAVAAGMIPVAVGTQTLGSVVRPASYCGVTGFKPTFGLSSTEGLLSMSPSLDTLGFFTETAQDMQLLWQALGNSIEADAAVAFGAPEPLPDLVEPEMAAAFQNTLAALRACGLRIEPLPITPMLRRLADEATLVMFYEGARSHEARYRQYGRELLDLADLVRDGLDIPQTRYQESLAFILESKQHIAECFRATPVILAPAATGTAPKGQTSTGDPRINSPWTALGVPAISIPLPVGGLPLGLQLTSALGQDARVLRAAVELNRLL